jgi:hypothetical protein
MPILKLNILRIVLHLLKENFSLHLIENVIVLINRLNLHISITLSFSYKN